jgi:hypothetical protein
MSYCGGGDLLRPQMLGAARNKLPNKIIIGLWNVVVSYRYIRMGKT